MNPTNGTPQSVLSAVNQLASSSPLVRQFELTFKTQDIHEEYGLWSIPVASGVQVGSSYELVKALTMLQNQIEQATHVPVVVLLDPAVD